MPAPAPTPLLPADPGTASVREAVRAEIAPLFADLHRFLDRRLAEVSTDVHGAAQLLNYSEATITGQLTRLHDEVARMVAIPSTATRNSGMELEAVVQTTELAANQIMEAAEAIGDYVRSAIPDRTAMVEITAKIDAIFEACAFQDLTGQRVRRAIEHLQHVESALSSLMAPPGEDVAIFQPASPTVESTGADLRQDAVDALFD